jgi:minimal PKS ketosynthase (KS/KS alpha)
LTRVPVITGIGVIAAGGAGREAFWDLITSGRTATRRISTFDTSSFRSRIAGECDFDPVAAGLRPPEIRRMDRAAQFAVVATREALNDSAISLDAFAPGRIAVALGSAVGCTMSLEREYRVVSDDGALWNVDHRYAVPHLFDQLVPSSMAREVAWLVGAEGPTTLISTGCTSGLDAVGHGCQLIAEGAADIVITGATDAPISPITLACFDAMKATSPRNDEAAEASRPFDRTRNGFVLAEGAAMFVVEDEERARRRGARVYARMSSFVTRANAYHMTGLRPDGREMAEAIAIAMDRARMTPSDIDYINAHGSSTKQNDRHETAAFKASLGAHAYRTPISSIKSMVGHSLGAIGSIEIAACALAIDRGIIPPTANLHEPDPECDLDYVPLTAREADVDVTLSVGSGFGGFQSAMILTAPAWSAA